MPRLSRDERSTAVGMLMGGMSQAAIARHFRCSRRTISRLIQRHRVSGSVADRRRSGRPRVTSQRQDRHIRVVHLRDRFRTAVQTARETPGTLSNRVSANTVRRRLREAGLRARRPFRGNLLTPHRREARYRWCRRVQRWTLQQWGSVLFSDESRFCVNRADGRERVWRRRGERYANCCVREADRWGGGSVMVWGAISLRHRTPLVVVDNTLTARRYIDQILEPHVVPFVREHNLLFQHDNARPHTANVTRAFLEDQNVALLPWPAFSPDLNPIEHVWDQLGRSVAARDPPPQSRRELVTALQEEWDNIPQGRIVRLVRSMRRRCHSCMDVAGGHIRY